MKDRRGEERHTALKRDPGWFAVLLVVNGLTSEEQMARIGAAQRGRTHRRRINPIDILIFHLLMRMRIPTQFKIGDKITKNNPYMQIFLGGFFFLGD